MYSLIIIILRGIHSYSLSCYIPSVVLLPLVESLLLESPLPPPPLSIGILLVELPEFDLEPDLEVSSSSVVGGSVASGVPVVTVWHLGQYI